MAKNELILFSMLLIFALINTAQSETIPPNIWEFTTDYYNVLGEPRISASIVGNPEYENGEISKIFIQLMNDGLVYGFEVEEEPTNANESLDAETEFKLEYDVTTAINIRGTMESEQDAPIKVLSGLQQGGSLRGGEISQPMEFEIEVYKNAPSGTYELTLNLMYQYQYDVKVEGYPNQEYDFWYETKNQTLPIQIKVKPKADFEVENVRAGLTPGGKSVLYITYNNVGTETAEDSVARISLVDPFSTTDDQAYLGNLNPGDSYEAQYLIRVDEDALPKTYGINTEVKYRDEHGDIQISDVMKASVRVSESAPLIERIGITGIIIVFGIIIGAGYYLYMKKGRKAHV